MRRTSLTAISVAMIMSASALTAFAGERTGNGGATAGPANANSICVFSGQNDDPTAPITLDFGQAPNGPGGRTQSYGQLVRYGLLTPAITTPGDNCRGGSNPARTR